MNKLRTMILVLVLAMAISSTAFAGPVPLPPDVKIEPPNDTIDANLAKYSGKWEGSTGTGMGVIFIVEKIEISFGLVKVHTVFAWDNRFVKEGWSRQRAYYDSETNSIAAKIKNPPVANYQIELRIGPNDTMTGTYTGTGSGSGYFHLKRSKD